MFVRSFAPWLAVALLAAASQAQTTDEETTTEVSGWRAPGSPSAVVPAAAESPAPAAQPGQLPARQSIARVTKGNGSLPRDQGQVWREYDIRPYTKRVTSTKKPEQAIVDWILRETGYEAWHSESVALLSASKDKLRVYHTPAVQAVVGELVDRFVSSEAESQAFRLRIVTIGNPNWRAKALRIMRPVPVQSQGVQGWLLAKEDAALLVAELGKRTDYREHASPHLMVHNGQSTVISTIRPRNYVRNVLLGTSAWPGYQPEIGQIEEGYVLEFSPLLSIDSQTVDAVIKVRLNQVEKMRAVTLEVPTVVAPRQRTKIEVPQMTSSSLHERFRWPMGQVLLLSMGVVATPAPVRGNPITAALPLPPTPSRADALLFVESIGKVTITPPTQTAAPSPSNYPTRY